MSGLRRNSVFVALQGTIGRELVFTHYTNKVVAARYPHTSEPILSEKQRRQANKMHEANGYAQAVMCSPQLKALYEKYLKEGESVYKKAIKDYLKKAKEE